MNRNSSSSFDLKLARICELCPVCRHARHRQQGVAYAFVKGIEQDLCPFCRAYERVHGKKAHERSPDGGAA